MAIEIAARHRLEAYQQGKLGGLCAVYATINALRLALADEGPLTKAQCRRLFADAIAMLYEQALPYPPPEVDRNRRQTYRAKVSQLKGDEDMSCSQARRVGGRAASGRRQRRC